MYDLIGDIHGHAAELRQLLGVMGYRETAGVYRHPDRKVIFLGDFIDRGPDIPGVLAIARSMVEAGTALAVMGNHEWNALAFATEDPDRPGSHLRSRSPKNIRQHQRTLAQVSVADWPSYLNWFRTLPLWLELEGLRAVHACWDPPSIGRIGSALAQHGGLTDSFLHRASRKDDPLHRAVEIVLKGKEMPLPAGVTFPDRDGEPRAEARTRWYLPADGQTNATYALQSERIDSDLALSPEILADVRPYAPTERPVFLGHYWLIPARPTRLAPNVACIDYSVAKDGFLCGYRWDGEAVLDDRRFIAPRFQVEHK